MRLKTPSFWYERTPGLRGTFLAPAAALYNAGRLVHQAFIKTELPPLPVICVGNLTAGGGGKTPTAASIMNLVENHKTAFNPAFLSRGYGGRLRGPLRVDPVFHTAADVGDEPLVLARHAPVFVSADRRAGALLAKKSGHDLLIMDDGLQNPSLKKTLSVVVIDGGSGFGNRLSLPAGPLREPLARGLARADAFIMIGEDDYGLQKDIPPGKLLFTARLRPAGTLDANASYIAFCGLARPDKFRRTLEKMNVRICEWHEYPDHYPYTGDDLAFLDRRAMTAGAHLVTTEKDSVRIPQGIALQSPLDILPVTLVFDDPEAVVSFMASKLKDSAR